MHYMVIVGVGRYVRTTIARRRIFRCSFDHAVETAESDEDDAIKLDVIRVNLQGT